MNFNQWYAERHQLEKYGWDHENFDKIREIVEQENSFLTKPIEISEGVEPCRKCKSLRTISVQRQVRSADEGFSLFVTCVDCEYQFRIN